MGSQRWKSNLLLLLAAAIWGFAFVAQRVGMQHIGPFTFNAIRFALGTLVLTPFLPVRRGGPRSAPLSRSGPQLRDGVLVGVILFLGASLQQIGIVTTTAGKAGFITGLYVVIVPFLGLFWRQRTDRATWLGACLAVAGLYLLCVRGTLTIGRGDLLVLASALFWALHVQAIGWLSPRTDPLRLACLQFSICSLLSLVTALLVETIQLPAIRAAALPILYAGMMSVGVAYTLQVVAQRRARPAHAAIILSLETVFAVLGGWLLLGENMSPRGLLGCVLMLGGMIVSQIRLPATSRPGNDASGRFRQLDDAT